MPDESEMSFDQLKQVARTNPIGLSTGTATATVFVECARRLDLKLAELDVSINELNKSSGALVTETNRLTRRILWLTVVGLILATVGVFLAIVQFLKG